MILLDGAANPDRTQLKKDSVPSRFDQKPDLGPASCPRIPGPPDDPRWVVVSHPFKGPGEKLKRYEVLQLTTAGTLIATGKTFDMGTSTGGQIHFTPDGQVGLVVQEDGTIGVFTIDSSGIPRVIHAAFESSTYASILAMDPAGDRIYLLNGSWRESGGGIYSVKIRCDGTLEDEGLLAPAKQPNAMLFASDGRALVVARDLLASTAGHDAFLLRWGDTPTLQAGVDAFGDDEAFVSSAALTENGRHLLITDNNSFVEGAGKRVAVVEVLGNELRTAQILTRSEDPLRDPAAVVTSPYDDTALLLCAQGDDIYILDYAPGNADAPFSIRGKLEASSATLLPSVAVQIKRGTLKGRVLISENLTIRQVQFEGGGKVSEVETFSFGEGYEQIPGALGVQP